MEPTLYYPFEYMYSLVTYESSVNNPVITVIFELKFFNLSDLYDYKSVIRKNLYLYIINIVVYMLISQSFFIF